MWIQGLKGLTSIQSFTLFNSRKKKLPTFGELNRTRGNKRNKV